MAPARAVPVTLEYSLGELKDRSAARRQQILLKAAPQVQALYKKLNKATRLGLDDVDEAVGEEALKFYNAVVADGRFVRLLKSNPQAAADKLGKRVRPEAIDAITKISSRIGGVVQGPVEAVIAVAVVIALAPKIPADGIVIDEMAGVRARL